MANISSHHAKAYLDWVLQRNEYGRVVSIQIMPSPPPAPEPLMLGAPAAIALGAAAVVAKNPLISRRFWGRKD